MYTPRSHQLIDHETAMALEMERALQPRSTTYTVSATGRPGALVFDIKYTYHLAELEYTSYARQLTSHEDALAIDMELLLAWTVLRLPSNPAFDELTQYANEEFRRTLAHLFINAEEDHPWRK